MNKLRPLLSRQSICHLLATSGNAFVDVLIKNGVIVYAAFKADITAGNVGLIATLAWSLFILPCFIFSVHGGYLGNRYDKRNVSMILRAIDICLAAFTALGFLNGNIALLLVVIFVKGITTALYGPIKYAMLSEFLPLSALATGSSLMEAGTMASILGGTYAGAIYGGDTDSSRICTIALAATVLSFLATCAGPKSTAGDPKQLSPRFNPLLSTFETLRFACRDLRCMAAIVALSWYWSIGTVYLSNVAVLVRTVLQGNEQLVASILLIFTLGVSCGLVFGSYGLHGKPNARLALIMALLIGLAGIDLYWAIPGSLLRMQFDFFILAVAIGIYAAHFSAVLYLTAGQQAKAPIFAAYNIMSSLLAVLALVLSISIVGSGISLPLCLAGFACATIPLTLLVNRTIRKCS